MVLNLNIFFDINCYIIGVRSNGNDVHDFIQFNENSDDLIYDYVQRINNYTLYQYAEFKNLYI